MLKAEIAGAEMSLIYIYIVSGFNTQKSEAAKLRLKFCTRLRFMIGPRLLDLRLTFGTPCIGPSVDRKMRQNLQYM